MRLKFYLCYFSAIILSSFAINYSFGYHGAKGIDVIFVSFILITISFYPLLQKYFLIPLLFLLAIYFPIGHLYGQPSVSIAASLLQTNARESFEFIKSIPSHYYALPLVLAISFLLLSRFTWHVNATSRIKNIYLAFLAIFIIVLCLTGKLPKIKAINFFTSIVQSFESYSEQMEQLKNSNISAEWSIKHNDKNDLNIVLIIGESMRTDYMSVFGYPLPTTPFLDDVNGTFYRNYISTAPNTFLSLPRTLALSSGSNVNLSYNIVSLASQAGFETFWFSNQGLLGQFDMPTSRVAVYSKHQIFLKKGHYDHSNTNDEALLPYLKKALGSTTQANNFIVLHTMGSHSEFSDRLNGEKPYFSYSDKELSDYISTYRKTDRFIKLTYLALLQEKKPFKLIYFSDHGLSRLENDDGLYLRHAGHTKQNYHVPLLVLSDSATDKKYIDTPKSAYDFISFFAHEAGIKIIAPQIHDWEKDINDIKVFDGVNMISYNKLANDPAVQLK